MRLTFPNRSGINYQAEEVGCNYRDPNTERRCAAATWAVEMARRPREIRVRMVGAPGLFAAEAVARLLIAREAARPPLSLVQPSGALPDGYKLPPHDPRRSLSPVIERPG